MIEPRLRNLGHLLLLALLIALLVLAFPYLASAFHLEAGGRAIAGPGPDQLSGLEHLQQAIRWDRNNAQAHRLLGQFYHAQGQWSAAVAAMTRFSELRPENLLGHIELAELYEEIDNEMSSMHQYDLAVDLPQAQVKAPDVVETTPYSQPGAPSWQAHVAQSSFTLPPSSEEMPILFMASPSWVTFTLSLPSEPSMLRFAMGLAPETQDLPGDGATFNVSVDGEQIFVEHLEKRKADEGWQERSLDLAAWAGQDVLLTLAVTPGPAGDSTYDWAGWRQPQVVDAQLPALEELHPREQMAEVWKRAGLEPKDLIAQGETLRLADQYEAAMDWYRRAMWLDPGLGDPWYYAGQLHEDQQQWLQALDAYERALAASHYLEVGRSSALYRIGAIHQRHLDPKQPEKALTAYQAALATDDFSSDRDAAWVHARLGQFYYARDRDAAVAEEEMLKGLDLAPGDKWLYVVLGDLYREEGRTDDAKAMYEQALAIDPEFEGAQQRLAGLE